MQHALSFEQAPPISVPFRFFLTAPWFGALAGMSLAWLGPQALASRWTSGTLALTHLFAAGFMLQVMCGALLQFVAVVAGANIWRPRLVATVVHPPITLGALLLAAAFLLSQPFLFMLAAVLFVLALGVFLTVMAWALLDTRASGVSVRVLRLALLGLLITAVLGVLLSATLGGHGGWPVAWPLFTLVDIHVAWGLGGWALMLVVGVSYMVVPMFQLTPAYPLRLAGLIPAGLFAILCLWSLQLVPAVGAMQMWQSGVAMAGVLLAGVFAMATLWLQSQRRRRRTDVTFTFWRGAMLALLGLVASWVVFAALPPLGSHARAPLWLGVLALPGVFGSVIMGMLYKIMPFLNWLHLQQYGGPSVHLPNMKQMIPERAMRHQMLLHFAALALLLAAVAWPPLTPVAGLAFTASCLFLEWNLIGAARVYARCKKQIDAAAPGSARTAATPGHGDSR